MNLWCTHLNLSYVCVFYWYGSVQSISLPMFTLWKADINVNNKWQYFHEVHVFISLYLQLKALSWHPYMDLGVVLNEALQKEYSFFRDSESCPQCLHKLDENLTMSETESDGQFNYPPCSTVLDWSYFAIKALGLKAYMLFIFICSSETRADQSYYPFHS
jgi:hypothetical protein